MEKDTQLNLGKAKATSNAPQAPLMASSRCLAAASPVLKDMLEVQGQGQFYTLDASADNRDGWEQVLCIISPDQCFPKVTLENATHALRVAHKYNMPKVLAFYELHAINIVPDLQAPSECVEWLDPLCTGGLLPDSPAARKLVLRFKELLAAKGWVASPKHKSSIKLTTLAPAACGLHVHAANMLLAAMLDLQQKVFKTYYRCSYCGYQFGVGAGNAQGVAPVAPKYCPSCRSAATHLSES